MLPRQRRIDSAVCLVDSNRKKTWWETHMLWLLSKHHNHSKNITQSKFKFDHLPATAISNHPPKWLTTNLQIWKGHHVTLSVFKYHPKNWIYYCTKQPKDGLSSDLLVALPYPDCNVCGVPLAPLFFGQKTSRTRSALRTEKFSRLLGLKWALSWRRLELSGFTPRFGTFV